MWTGLLIVGILGVMVVFAASSSRDRATRQRWPVPDDQEPRHRGATGILLVMFILLGFILMNTADKNSDYQQNSQSERERIEYPQAEMTPLPL